MKKCPACQFSSQSSGRIEDLGHKRKVLLFKINRYNMITLRGQTGPKTNPINVQLDFMHHYNSKTTQTTYVELRKVIIMNSP